MLTSGACSGRVGGRKIQLKRSGVIGMFWLQLVGIAALITVGIFLIAYLEETLVSGPRRRQLQEKAREKLAGNPGRDQ